MKNIELDNEVYAFLQNKAIPFVEKPNDTLRRLFGIDNAFLQESTGDLMEKNEISKRTKGPRTSLILLVQAGLLEERQIL